MVLSNILIFWDTEFGVFISCQLSSKLKEINTWNISVCVEWMYTLYKFHFLNGISEINQLFDDILIIWPAPVYIYIYIYTQTYTHTHTHTLCYLGWLAKPVTPVPHWLIIWSRSSWTFLIKHHLIWSISHYHSMQFHTGKNRGARLLVINHTCTEFISLCTVLSCALSIFYHRHAAIPSQCHRGWLCLCQPITEAPSNFSPAAFCSVDLTQG